jgi:hypothetical protein
LLIELLDSLTVRMKPSGLDVLKPASWRARRKLAKLTRTLRQLLSEPQQAERVVKEMQSNSRSRGAGVGVEGKVKRVFRGSAHADANGHVNGRKLGRPVSRSPKWTSCVALSSSSARPLQTPRSS